MNRISFNINKTGEIFDQYWKKEITAGRAAEGLREDWRNQLKEVQREIGFEYIRFHGIFHDDMMIYKETAQGVPYYNWQYFDSLFDFLLSIGLHPILELGFMPSALSSGSETVFWWKGNTTPPKDYQKWFELIKETLRHSINRYGINEVLKWYFEVWNEPNLDSFWSSTQEEYFKLYNYSAKAIKSVDSRLKVGGPSTSGADFRECKGRVPYVEEFLKYCNTNQLPVDFVSAHPYPTYWPLDTEGVKLMGYMDEFATVNHLKAIRGAVMNSSYKNAEIHLTEWNSSPSPRDLVHDTAFMAPYIIDNNIKGIGLVDSLGFWTFTDVFEENGAGDTLFHGGFGLINLQGLKKASYYGYWFLSKLGSEKIASGENYFVTKKDGKIVILLWNYCHYKEHFANGDRSELNLLERYDIFDEKEISINLNVEGLDGNYKILKYVFGRNNGSAYDVWVNNSAPNYPTEEELNIISKKVGPEGSIDYIKNINVFNQEIILKPHDVVLIELNKQF